MKVVQAGAKLLLLIIALIATTVFGADKARDPLAPYLLYLADASEQDVTLVSQLLSEGGVTDAFDHWRHQVAIPFAAAEARGMSRAMLIKFIEDIKGNLIADAMIGEVSPPLAKTVGDLLAGLATGEISQFVFASIPEDLLVMIKSAKFLRREQQASLSFRVWDMLHGGMLLDDAARILAVNLELLSQQRERSIVSDPRINGVTLGAVAAEHGVMTLPLRRRMTDVEQFNGLVRKLDARLAAFNVAVSFADVPFDCVTVEETQEGDVCGICGDDSIRELYGNVCDCNKDILLCATCITQQTLNNLCCLKITSVDDVSDVTIEFSLRIPVCPFCKKSFYAEEKSLLMLGRVLSVEHCKSIVFKALVDALTAVDSTKLPGLIARLISSSPPLRNIITNTPDKKLLAIPHLAMQIFRNDRRMKEGTEAPFTDETIWTQPVSKKLLSKTLESV